MKYSLQARNFLGLTHSANPSYRFGFFNLPFLLILALYFLVPTKITAAPLDEATAITTKRLTIKNDGDCTVGVYHWLASGDVHKKDLKAGRSWSVDTERGQMWRVINTNPDWKNLKYDEHYTVGNNNRQTWSIKPVYCEDASATCGAELEHFGAVAETGCDKNDGKIVTDPHINAGTALPYYVEYSYNGTTKKHGPYAKNQDNYITGLTAGTYKDLTVIDANGCTKNHGDVTVEKATCESTCNTKVLTIKNNGTCTVGVYHWLASGDIHKRDLRAGDSWSVDTERGQMWRVINTNPDWKNLSYDEHFTVDSDCEQTWSIKPVYCEGTSSTCGAELEHFGAVAETGCDKNDGKIVTDPHINAGTVLPYYIEYSYNGRTEKHGPYAKNRDNYITGLAAGTYEDLTIIDANGCTQNHGDVTVEKATCEEPVCTKNLTITNNGNCTVEVYLWLASGDIYQTDLRAGASWSVDTEERQMWRVINTNPVWKNLEYDEHITVGSDCEQTWTIEPTYCDEIPSECNAELEHFGAVAETGCDRNDGKIVTDPYINKGLVLPYYVEYSFNGNTERHGPFRENKDNFITDLAPGTYSDLTVIDGNDCSRNHGDVIVEKAECPVVEPPVVEPPVVVIPAVTINDVTVNEEDGVAELMICIDQAASDLVTVSYITSDDTAVDGEDYKVQEGTVIIEAGELCAKVSFSILDDELEEATEKFLVVLGAPSNATIADEEGMITILDTDAPAVIPTITINDVTVNEEDGVAELMICIDQAASDLVTVSYITSDDTAVDGEDYKVQEGTVIIEAGELCAKVSFSILDDELEEATEKFLVVLGAPSNATIADEEGMVTILDTDEPAVIPTITINDVTVNEEDGVAELMICIDQAASDLVTVSYITSDDTAIDGEDYQTQEGIVIIEAGELCAKVSFPILDDELEEATEKFLVVLGAPSNATIADEEGMVTILDTDEPAVIPTITINDVTVNEEDGVAELMICIDQAASDLVTVSYITSDDTAIDGEDYQTQEGIVIIEAGELCEKVSFPILDDELEEATEKFLVVLDAPSNATIADEEGMVTILDTDEPAVIPTITINDVTVNEEEGVAELMICIDQTASDLVTVSYITSDDTAIDGEDYQTQEGIVIIEAGELCEKVSFPILDDELEEATEKFLVVLDAPSNATIADEEGMVTILDTDEPVKSTLSISDVVVNEEDGTATLEICLDNIATEFVYVRYSTADDSAKQGTDYRSQSSYAFIPEGKQCAEVLFNIINDNKEEAEEVFKVVLSSPFNAEIVDAEGMVTILDTDLPSCDTKGGRITGGPFEFCVGDGNADNIATGAIRTSGNAGAYTQWVVTDADATTILGLPNSPSDVDFDDAGMGTCLIWYLSHDGSLTGAAEGAAITDLDGCFSLSNSISVNRVECIEPKLNISDVVVNEEDGVATLEICLDQPTTEFVYVRYTTTDDSAVKNQDYKGQASYAFIAEGGQCTTVEFDIIDNEIEENDEIFLVTLSTPYNAVIADGEGTVTILDADVPVVMIPDPKLAIDDVVVFEDEGLALLTICLDAVSTSAITVAFNTFNETADAGNDYQETGGVVTIPAGMNCTEIELPIIDDKDDESDEVFVVELSNPTNATIADTFGTVTILDNDEAIVIQPIEIPLLTITDVTVNENEGYAHLEICLDQPAIQTVRVDCITADGTAIAGVDYLQTEDVAIIPVGQTCTQASFKILDDSNEEDTEFFYVNLSNVSNAIIADDQGIITILDDDEIAVVECPDTEVYIEDGNINITGLDAPIEIVQIFNASFNVVFQCRDNCEATEVAENLPFGEYTVRIKSYNSSWDLLCTEETKVNVLDENIPPAPLTCAGNITNGGRIAGEESFCGIYNPTIITSEVAASGGADSRDIEYLWLASTVDCPSEIEDQIPGATGASYDPGPITETTYFVRCSRRLGCTVWVESNCIVKDVFCPDGNMPEGDEGNTPAVQGNLVEACGEVNITYGNGQIEMTGKTSEEYHFQVNAIDQGWAVVLGCASDCGYSQTATDLADGTYLVTIYDASWNKLCQVKVALASGLTNDTASSRNRVATSSSTLQTTKQVDKTFAETKRTVIEGVTQANIKQAQAANIRFYPNPVRDVLTLDLAALAGQAGKAYLSNQMGQIVKTVDLGVIDASPTQIQMGLLSNGLYHLTIVAEGQLVTTEKIMVQQY